MAIAKTLPQTIYRIIRKEPYWLASIAITGLLIALRQLGGLQPLELFAFDAMVRLQAEQEPDPRLLIVEITEEDIRNQKEWPLSDRTMADAITKLQAQNPKAIGIDIYRDIPQGEGQELLTQALVSPNVIAIESLGISEDDSIPAPAGISPDRVGFNDLPIDSDGILRRSLLFAALENEELYSFALQLSLKYLEDRNVSFSVDRDAIYIGSTQFKNLTPDAGGYDEIDTAGYQMLLNYRSSNWVARKITLTELLSGQVKPSWIEDKVVLIGVTAPSLKDFFYTPYSAQKSDEHVMSGVLVHAQIVSQILTSVLDNQLLFWYLPPWAEVGWIALWALAGGFLVWKMKRSTLLGLTLIASFVGIGGLCLIAFNFMGWIPFAAPALAFLLTGGTLMTYQVFYQSFYDPLTGLPNRSLFIRQLRRALQQAKAGEMHASSAVLLLDLDHFKAINESYGHRAGDLLLLETTGRIRQCLPAQAKLARIGGDEFAILLSGLEEASESTKVADTLYNELSEPFETGGRIISTTFSIGIALDYTNQSCQAETLMQDAHRAMSRARALGKEHYEVFDPGMRSEAVERFKLEGELRQAIESKEFMLYYQPIVNLSTGKLAGFEALVRWQHPEHGFVSPGTFIPAAEESGLIVPLGSWILEEACAQMSQWQKRLAPAQDLVVSVNLSTKQFNQKNLAQEVGGVLRKTGLKSQSLKLELTESAAMEDVNGTIDQLTKLKALNLKLSLDDFGTGYSSLSYLHQLPTDTLKVDQSFVGRMEEQPGEDGEIVKTIISLGHQLGMDVIAEGIETAEQLAGLRRLSCNYGQGYFFAKPLPKEAAEALIEEDRDWLETSGDLAPVAMA